MAEVRRPLDAKMEGKVPPVEAKDEGDETAPGSKPEDDKEKK